MIKKIFKKIIIFFLRVEANLILRKYNPKIVAVSGSVGKTSTKDAIAMVLGSKFNVRKSEKSYNSEIGVPLTIIGAKSAWNNPLHWFFVLLKGLVVFLKRKKESTYPQWLVLEMGVDRPRDMEHLLKWIKPDIAVITALAEIPVHVEYFKSPEDLAKEKMKLVKKLKPENYAILNGDDKTILGIGEKTEANIITYGFSENLDLTASNYRLSLEGITFKIDYKGNIVPVRVANVFSKQYVYCALASLAVGISQDLNLVEITEALSKFKPPLGRLNLIEGIKGSFIFDDSYNSSPVAVAAALESLKDLFDYMATGKAGRKIAVLGDMLELGKFTIDEHKKVGRLVKESEVDLLFIIGPRSKFIAEEARVAGLESQNIFEFSNSDEAKKVLQEKIQEGDLILVKGSQGMRTEKVVEEIMAHPEQKEQLLVRQEKEWQNK